MRIADLREAIEAQQADAERQQEELEQAAMEGLSVQEQLIVALNMRLTSIIEHLQANDTAGSGTVSRQEFIAIRKMLKVPPATAVDIGAFFDVMDHTGAGELDYSQLTRIARRRASVSGSSGSRSQTSVEPAELDLSLQGVERSRQLKELIFSREVTAVADFEKQKEVKSFVATGQPLMAQYVIDATRAARAQHQADREHDERTAARARTAAVREGERVRVSEPVANIAFEALPAFSAFDSDTWGMREGVLGEFHLAVRVGTLRSRVNRRIKGLKTSLQYKGISLTDKHAVHEFVRSRTKGSASRPASGGNAGGSEDDATDEMAHGLSAAGIAHIAFPTAPKGKGGMPKGDPLPIKPIAPFDNTKLFALRVPRRHVRMDYRLAPLTAPGAFPPIVFDRPLRVGATFESGRLLPTGTPQPVPDTWGLPPLLLEASPWPQPAEVEPVAGEGFGATKEVDEDADVGAPDAEADAGGVKKGAAKPPSPFKPRTMPRLVPPVLAQPPICVETDVRQMLRPSPLRCNEYWKHELIGWSSAILLLEDNSLSFKWRAAHEPWVDALVELPENMTGVHPPDCAEELGEDESDTEIDPALLFPPSLDQMSSVFDLPPSLAGPELPEEEAVPSAPECEQQLSPTAAAAAVDEGDVTILPKRSLAVDVHSESARAEVELNTNALAKRRDNRLRLCERMAQLNELIEQPRHQLSLA